MNRQFSMLYCSSTDQRHEEDIATPQHNIDCKGVYTSNNDTRLFELDAEVGLGLFGVTITANKCRHEGKGLGKETATTAVDAGQ